MSALSGVQALVASVAGPLLFGEGYVVNRGAATSDGRGGFSYAQTQEAVQALKVNKAKGDEAVTPAQAVKSAEILVLLSGVVIPVRAGSVIALKGLAYTIISTSKDPANAVLTCQCERIGTAIVSAGGNVEIILEAN